MKTALLSVFLIAAVSLPVVSNGILREGDKSPVDVPQSADSRSAQRRIFASGVVEGAAREASLRFQQTGRLEEILVFEGDRVRKGDVLARLHCGLWEAELAQAEAGLRLAEAEKQRIVNGTRKENLDVFRTRRQTAEVRMKHAEKSLRRAQALDRAKVISQQALEDRTADVDAANNQRLEAIAQLAEVSAAARPDELQIADAKIAVAASEFRRAGERLAMCVLRAAQDGNILRVCVEPGEIVSPDASLPVLVMADAKNKRVRAYVEELEAIHLRTGTSGHVTADGIPERQFRGRVIFCAPSLVHRQTITNEPGERHDVKVREVVIQLEPQDGLEQLVLGLPVEVCFVEDPASN